MQPIHGHIYNVLTIGGSLFQMYWNEDKKRFMETTHFLYRSPNYRTLDEVESIKTSFLGVRPTGKLWS